MTPVRASHFLARDAYSSWKRRVTAAESSIRVITPYFDAMLSRLLKNSSLEVDVIQVLTDLSPESGTTSYRRQLLAARSLITAGIEVRSVPRIHAKVLVCDDDIVVVGSQNFTTYARGSKETTVVSDTSLEGSAFLQALDEWWESAMVVGLDFIEALLEELDGPMRAVEEASRSLQVLFGELLDAERDRLAEIERRRLRPIRFDIAQVLRSDRIARTVARASLQYVDWYESLVVYDQSTTLARWVVGTGADTRIVRLTPTLFYPILLDPTGRMGFARVAKTRITYIRTGGEWGESLQFGSFSYRMTVSMPEVGTDDYNLRVVLRPTYSPRSASVELCYRFVGDSVTLVRSATKGSDQVYGLAGTSFQLMNLSDLHAEVTDPDLTDSIVDAALKSGFSYRRLGIDNHNADKFFPRGIIELRLAEYGKQPVLIASSK